MTETELGLDGHKLEKDLVALFVSKQLKDLVVAQFGFDFLVVLRVSPVAVQALADYARRVFLFGQRFEFVKYEFRNSLKLTLSEDLVRLLDQIISELVLYDFLGIQS